VLDTAAALFWEKGYAATTTREIAAAVGIQQASLYYHVASKEDLLYQLCVSSMERLLAAVQTALTEAVNPMERIRIFIHAHLTGLLRQQIRHVNILTELRALSKAHHREVLALRKDYAELARSVLAAGQSAGVIRADIPAKYLYLALLNILNWAVVWFRREEALAAEQLAELFYSIYLGGAAAFPERIDPKLPGFAKREAKSAAKGRKPVIATRKNTSQRLVDAAASLFARTGYEATSTREIASALGIQKASLYYHIGSKEELLLAICQSSLEQIRRDVEAAMSAVSDPLERISALVSAHIESMLRDQEKHSVAVAEMHLLSPGPFAEVRHLRDGYENLVRSVLQEAQDAGVLRADIPVKYLCLGLLGLMNRVEVWYRRNGALSPGQFGQLLAAIYLSGAASRPRD
jgi:AcrR family transcriptional regulator